MSKEFSQKLVLSAFFLALIVVSLGAYTRLTNSGLGCPDWPGCYGHWVVPKQLADTEAINRFTAPVSLSKAWTEMVHRYCAGFLGLLIFVISLCMFFSVHFTKQQKITALSLLLIVLVQACLGMWTVTLQLLPLVVMGHLMGGVLLVSTLWWHYLNLSKPTSFFEEATKISALNKGLLILTLFFLVVQIALGGWVSANYSALSCIGFPRCNTLWWPNMDFLRAYDLFAPMGINYEGGQLSGPARTAIHMGHRLGALVVSFLLISCVFSFYKKGDFAKRCTSVLVSLLALQITLGIINVTQFVPLWGALMHNSVAVLLLLTLLTLIHRCFKRTL